jgi:hypothetical protein
MAKNDNNLPYDFNNIIKGIASLISSAMGFIKIFNTKPTAAAKGAAVLTGLIGFIAIDIFAATKLDWGDWNPPFVHLTIIGGNILSIICMIALVLLTRRIDRLGFY